MNEDFDQNSIISLTKVPHLIATIEYKGSRLNLPCDSKKVKNRNIFSKRPSTQEKGTRKLSIATGKPQQS
jgi:hypothetical protein